MDLKAYEVRPNEKMEMLPSCFMSRKDKPWFLHGPNAELNVLQRELVRDGFNAAMIHGNRSQSQRNNALSGFQEGWYRALMGSRLRRIHRGFRTRASPKIHDQELAMATLDSFKAQRRRATRDAYH